MICLLAVLPAAAALAAAPDLDRLTDTVRAGARPADAMKVMREVWQTERWGTFSRFGETADYLKARLTRNGLRNIERIEAPADGRTQYGFWTMPLAWDARSATLEIVEPEAGADRMLADFERVPASLGMWSAPTPPEGITAELVEYSRQADLRGKFVLTRAKSDSLKFELSEKGAAGAINAFTENPDLKDDRQWINAWGDYGWAYTKMSRPLVSFSVTPNQAARLREMLGRGRVRLRARVDARIYEGGYPYVTAVLPGREPGEEVLTLGHTAEQGAQDNATGVAAMVEALATIQRLVRSRKLPQPQRSIRILLMPEYYGTHHYIATNPERIRRTVAAFCLDTPAGLYEMPGTEYTFYLNPWSGYSYTDPFVLELAAAYFPKVNRPWHWKEFMPGTDSFLGEPTIGVPTVWPYAGSGVHTHHNSADTPDRVDERSLRDLVVINAAFLYFFANASTAEARWLGEKAAAWSRSRTLPPVVHNQMVLSVLRLAAAKDREALRAELSRLLVAAPPAAKSGPIVKRKRFGTLPLDDLAPPEREGFPNGAWARHPSVALYWADGKRTLGEIVALTTAEAGPTKLDYEAYFRFLARKGYVELVE